LEKAKKMQLGVIKYNQDDRRMIALELGNGYERTGIRKYSASRWSSL
jgi:hypothetical protein